MHMQCSTCFHPMQITCGRCGIPDSAESTTPSAMTSPVIVEEQSPSPSPAASDSLPPVPLSVVSPAAPSENTPSSPSTQNVGTPVPGLGSPLVPSSSPMSPYTTSQAPTADFSSLQVSPKPLPSVPETPGSPFPPTTPSDISTLPSLPETPGSPLPPPTPSDNSTFPSISAPANSSSQPHNAVAYGTPTAAPASPGVCADLQSDCTLICQQLNNDCSQPGGIGDYLR